MDKVKSLDNLLSIHSAKVKSLDLVSKLHQKSQVKVNSLCSQVYKINKWDRLSENQVRLASSNLASVNSALRVRENNQVVNLDLEVSSLGKNLAQAAAWNQEENSVLKARKDLEV